MTVQTYNAAEHDDGVRRPQHKLTKEKLHLVDGADTRHSRLAVGTDHDVIQKIDPKGDDIR